MKKKIYQIVGSGIAGQVLAKELTAQGQNVWLSDTQAFPRRKVCGGVLQQETWQYLKAAFHFNEDTQIIRQAAHYSGKQKVANQNLSTPMVYIRRFEMDHTMMQSFGEKELNQSTDGADVIKINASGIQGGEDAEWLGFESISDPVKCLEMRYGNKIYAGLCPDTDNQSHLAFVIHKEVIKSKKIQEILRDELGIHCESRPKGTPAISYRYYSDQLAVGDAKMTSHPLFGFGMKHAVLSARLLAKCVQRDRMQDYSLLHRKIFSNIIRANRLVDQWYRKLNGRVLAAGMVLPGVVGFVHQQIHSKKEERFIEAL